PSSYLSLTANRIGYQARCMALQAYHAFLPISQATEAEVPKRLARLDSALIASSGVADPLLAASGDIGEEMDGLPRRYIVAPTGGDARKNLPIVIAAEGLNRSRGRRPNGIVIVGHLSPSQRKALFKLARRSGLSDADI